MTEQDRQEIEKIIDAKLDQFEANMIEAGGTRMGEIVRALLAVTTALRQQPGFDNAGFNTRLKRDIAMGNVDGISRDILKALLGEPLE